ncbi:hypothetical protein CBR_g2660 [Chara braunii]|uniref:Reverse transcriptase domain-containing protein n=1 Tax=Chara braunii TaxID=69332 RepID=A0A388KDI9_CHABU|nr:hypothetical protein CBR_g2660 [Chara braunii]|eukprot:GBG68109.1 hypothetical protein CBR_g2660 [Chara braunii]
MHHEVLKLPDPDKPFIVTTDASQYGIGAVLAQQKGPKLRPVEYLSKKMLSKKLAKSTYEKKLYAIYKALTHWRHYLLGRFFIVGTDHQTLKWMRTQLVPSDALKRWIEVIERLRTILLAEAYREDPFMSEIIRRLEAKDKVTSVEFELVNGLLFLEKVGNKRLCVPNPESLRSLFLVQCHDAIGHFGYKKTAANLLQQFWRPTMMRDAKLYVETCQVCQRDKPRTQAPLGLLKPLPIPEKPGESLSMDFMDTLVTSKSGMRHIFVIVDRFNGKIETVENGLMVMQAQVTQTQASRPPLPPQEAVVPARITNRGFNRRDPTNEQCKYCTMVGHFVRACPRLNYDIMHKRCSRTLRGEIIGPRGEKVNWNSPGGMRRAVIALNNLNVSTVEAEPVAELAWEQARGRGPQANFILANDWRDRANVTTRQRIAEKKVVQDAIMEDVGDGPGMPQEVEAQEQEKVYGKPREEAPVDKAASTKKKFRYQIPILTMPEIDDTLSKLLGTMVSVSFQTMSQASSRLLKGLRQLLTRRRIEVEEGSEQQEEEKEEEAPGEVANFQRIPEDLDELEKVFADIRLSLPDREGGEVMRAPLGTKLSFHALPLPLDARDRPYTAMHTPVGQLQMQVTPIGFTNAVAKAQRRMLAVAGDMFPAKCEPYINDNPIEGARDKDETEIQPGIRRFVGDHLQDIKELLRRFLEYNITSNGPKSILAMLEVTILGFRCGSYGRKPDLAKTDKISQWPTPLRTTTEEELMAMVVEGGREAVMSLVESWEQKQQQYLVNQVQNEQEDRRDQKEFFLIRSYDSIFKEIGLLLVGNKEAQKSATTSACTSGANIFCRQDLDLDGSEANINMHNFPSFSKKALDVEAKIGHDQTPTTDGRKKSLPCNWKAKGRIMFVDNDGSTIELEDDFQAGVGSKAGSVEASGGGVVAAVTQKGEPVKMSPEIEGVVAKYPDLFEEPKGVVEREAVHAIEIIPGSSIPKGRIYQMSPGELDELRWQLKELVEKGWIRSSVSPYGSLVLFVPKKGGTLRMSIDYRGLNAITVKNQEPLPHIDDLLDRVQGCRYFSKIDLKSGYHQIAIRPKDQHKTAFQTRYGLYKFVLMPFGLCNAPGTFQHAMNEIFHDYLDKFVILYLDDILIFSKTVEEHVAHLDKVLSLLRQLKFKINGEKCEFGRTRILYLGYEISTEGLKPHDAKVPSISDWPRPQSVTEMRSFLGMTDYYRNFVKNYSIVAAPLTDLIRLDTPWEWTDRCEAVFGHLKHALTHHEVLKLPDLDKPFIVTTDASQYGIGAVLAQQKGPKLRPVEYMSKKMPSQKLAKSTYEKELFAIYKALTHWRHYLLGRFFIVRIDHETLKWIRTQPVLSDALKRWIEVIKQYDFETQYVKGEYNKVVDALSRRPDFSGALITEVGVADDVTRSLVDAYREDLFMSEIIRRLEAKDRVTSVEFELVNGLLFLKKAGNRRLCVTNRESLRSLFLVECHDATKHFGYKKTAANLLQQFWWPTMMRDAKLYVETCQFCYWFEVTIIWSHVYDAV